MPRSATGSTSGRRRANIRNICAVQTPIPFTWVRCSITVRSSRVRQTLENHIAALGVFRQLADVKGLLPRKTQLAHALRAKLQDSCRSQRTFTGGGVQPGENHTRHPAAKLLKHNGSDKRFKTRLTVLEGERTHPLDDPRNHRVGIF